MGGCCSCGGVLKTDFGMARANDESFNDAARRKRSVAKEAELSAYVDGGLSVEADPVDEKDGGGTGVLAMARSLSVKKGARNKDMHKSQVQYANKDQTIIFFDWDDTLLPTSWLRTSPLVDSQGRINPNGPGNSDLLANLMRYMSGVTSLLRLAQDLGTVVIVTNARRPWVDASCRAFLPGVRHAMQRIPVLYGLELVNASGAQAKKGAVNLTQTKVAAMRTAMNEFYSRYEGQSWKNVVSIGDALFEHDAIRAVVKERPEYTAGQKCRVKTIKLLEGPSMAGLEAELKVVAAFLRKIVVLNDDMGLDFGADEAIENQLATLLRSEVKAPTIESASPEVLDSEKAVET